VTVWKTAAAGAGAAVVLALAAVPAAKLYYSSSRGQGCARCHEIRRNFDTWSNSAHRKVNCTECHASSLAANVRRVARHATGNVPERVHLQLEDALQMVDRCRSCHQAEFAQWRSGPHSTTFARIFMDPEHNRKRRLMDDCLRCHGMYFQGNIGDVVTPVDAKGPWTLKNARLINAPAIPCLACHSMHREGEPLGKRERGMAAKQETYRPSLSLMDRRSQLHLGVAWLAVPSMREGGRAVKLSPDRRQSLCYQCHAPLATQEVASGDDRTPVGVHEGVSCLACHQKHGQFTRASCADCHPRLSNCGIDVEKMDTTFLSKSSRHNIHFVKCADCHPKGVPKKRIEQQRAALTAAQPSGK
jgi:hypothetical protein